MSDFTKAVARVDDALQRHRSLVSQLQNLNTLLAEAETELSEARAALFEVAPELVGAPTPPGGATVVEVDDPDGPGPMEFRERS